MIKFEFSTHIYISEKFKSGSKPHAVVLWEFASSHSTSAFLKFTGRSRHGAAKASMITGFVPI